MSDHQFEKNVQQKMDELRLHPSETVWKEVEKKIRPQKRRRRGLIWIPLMAALFTGFYFYYSGMEQSEKKNLPVSEHFKKPNTVPPSETSTPQTESNSPEQLQEKNIKQNNPTDQNPVKNPEKSIISNNAPVIKDKQLHNKTRIAVGEDSKTEIVTNKRKVADISNLRYTSLERKTGIDQAKTTERAYKKISSEPIIAADTNSESIANQNKKEDITSVKKIKDDSTLATIEVAIPEIQVAQTESPPALPAPIERLKRKWQIGITFNGGVSKISAGGFFDFTEKSMVQDVAPSSFSMPVPRNAVILKPSPIYPGFSMQVKGFAKTELRKRLRGSFGLGYGQYQTQIRVGQMVQSSQAVFTSRGVMDVQGYYRAEPNKVYTNRFHFIELPVELEYRLNKSPKTPVSIHAGATYSRLIGSNALHFDGSSRVYYKDNSVFNKNLAGITGGLSVGVLQKFKHPLMIGSSFHYRVTNLMHRNIYDRKHLLAAGIDLKILLKKS